MKNWLKEEKINKKLKKKKHLRMKTLNKKLNQQ